MDKKRLAIGFEFYKEFIEKKLYYVDKTLLIRDLFERGSKVNLFTRPRRFGKTLALTMLKVFFEQEIDREGNVVDNSHYFEGMKIMDAGEEYTEKLGKYPVIFMSLKSAKQPTFEMAYEVLVNDIAMEFLRHSYVLNSDVLDKDERDKFSLIMSGKAKQYDYAIALKVLSSCLEKYHGRKAIILLDEYDVPLENSYFQGFYDEMVDFIRSFFESALKTNDSMEMAVITGCLRISKESIFTGLNNLKVVSVLNEDFAEYFGFTVPEVEDMLNYFNLQDKVDELKEWYDGYLFGKTEVYNPWSVINYLETATINHDAFPKPYWSNTSSNSIIRGLIEHADDAQKNEIEELILGETIEKPVHEDVTYADINTSEDNLWNFLFFTGYLKKAGESLEGNQIYIKLKIPNEEIRYIYQNAIREWLGKRIKSADNTVLFQAILEGNAQVVSQEISRILFETISYYDYTEAYYHGILVGILQNIKGYKVRSNREKGNGRPDIIIQSPSIRGKAVILEIKVSQKPGDLERKAREAVEQIKNMNYIEGMQEEGYKDILAYGIAFYKKDCLVEQVSTGSNYSDIR